MTGEMKMRVKIPSVRRTDSLYAKLGGKVSLEAIVDDFYERLAGDRELASCLAGAKPAALKSEQVCFLTAVLGGPAAFSGAEGGPLKELLPAEDKFYARAGRHLTASLRALRVPKHLAEEVVALAAPRRAETVKSDLNPAATPQEGIKPMSKNNRSHAAVLDEADVALGTVDQEQLHNYAGEVAAIRKSQAVIEFQMDGTILDANDNFLHAMGYTLDEIKGRHHSMFVDEEYRRSPEYKEFWAKLNRGEYQAAEYKRLGKGGKEVWIQASYNPILDQQGKPFKVVKFATDVTEQKLSNADYQGQIAAIKKAQAVIEFKMDGTILTANDNFL